MELVFKVPDTTDLEKLANQIITFNLSANEIISDILRQVDIENTFKISLINEG